MLEDNPRMLQNVAGCYEIKIICAKNKPFGAAVKSFQKENREKATPEKVREGERRGQANRRV